MKRADFLVDELQHSVFGDPWHGLSAKLILEDVSEEIAFARPIPNAHNIAELTLHMWAWTEEVVSRFKGKEPDNPVVGDWPELEKYKHEGWNNIREKFYTATRELTDLIQNFPEEKFEKIIGGPREPSLGTGKSYESTIHGLTQHNAYHSGQISLLKKFDV